MDNVSIRYLPLFSIFSLVCKKKGNRACVFLLFYHISILNTLRFLPKLIGEVTDRKKVSLGTQPISLNKFSSEGTTHAFTSSDGSTVIYSTNKKLLYNTVNLKEVNHTCPLNTIVFLTCISVSRETDFLV